MVVTVVVSWAPRQVLGLMGTAGETRAQSFEVSTYYEYNTYHTYIIRSCSPRSFSHVYVHMVRAPKISMHACQFVVVVSRITHLLYLWRSDVVARVVRYADIASAAPNKLCRQGFEIERWASGLWCGGGRRKTAGCHGE